MTPEKFVRHVLGPIGQQCDSEKIFLTSELDRMVKQLRTVSVSLKFFMNDQIFQQDDETSFRGADREEQIDHANNGPFPSQNKDAPAARLFENQTQTAQLLMFVRAKVALLLEEFAEHFGQLIQISLRRWLNDNAFAHRLYCL